MGRIPFFQVDAFTDRMFAGNSAGVCPLEHWLDDHQMQSIAAENNLAETAFFVREADSLRIRWFTPAVEVDLCGHATLASAHVLFSELGHPTDSIVFDSRSGPLTINKSDGGLCMDLPSDDLTEVTQLPAEIEESIGAEPDEVQKGRTDYLLVYENQTKIETIAPDMRRLKSAPARGIIVSAPGDDVDFVSRFFAPMSGIDEDPVTGSAHTTLTPYWASRLSKSRLTARQLSQRGGQLTCELVGDRVRLFGGAVTYLKGEICLS